MTVTLTRRERQRAATVEEIKEVARGLMRAQGTIDVRFTDIAKEMGMTPPALYRYFADRDALLTELIAEAYRELGREVAEAREQRDPDDIGGRWIAVIERVGHTRVTGGAAQPRARPAQADAEPGAVVLAQRL